MSYSSSNLITVRRICISDGIVPLDHVSPIKKKNTYTSSQIKTETATRKVLAVRSACLPKIVFTPTLSPIVEGNEKEKMKTQKVAAKKKIISTCLKPLGNSFLKRTTSGNFTDVLKNYWKNASFDPFAILDEGSENIPPNEHSSSSVSKEKSKAETMKQRPGLIQSSFSLEQIEQLNKKKVGGFWEESENTTL